ncbi:CaiB/BaiF CoA transferase family protein [Halovulum sp. GXIMD14794]
MLVVDLCQFLSGPYASLRLQDLGARVIKVERPGAGDLTRQLYLSDTVIDGESTMFHAINRGKESIALDLKRPEDLARVQKLIAQADVVMQNFRPGVIERLGLDYGAVRALRPGIVYASISGYGPDGPWAGLPGQDLLAQAKSGLMWLNGGSEDGPVPFGLAVADMMAGATIAQGILAALVGRGLHGRGAHVETSLLEALLDLQFEVLATHFNDGGRLPERSRVNPAHAGLAAPYGVYRTADGHLAIAMTPLPRLVELLNLPELTTLAMDPRAWFARRDEIKTALARRLAEQPTAHWLALLEPEGIWSSEVLDWTRLLSSPAFERLDMMQGVHNNLGTEMRLLRSPLRIDGERAGCTSAAPDVGEHGAAIAAEFGL